MLLPVCIDELDLTLEGFIYMMIVFIICSIFTITLADKQIRTPENQKLLGEVLGFRNFIKTADLELSNFTASTWIKSLPTLSFIAGIFTPTSKNPIINNFFIISPLLFMKKT